MIHSLRQAKTPDERARFLNFKPVPRERERADGWTPERQRAFIEALADCGVVSRAARMVGMAPEGAYVLRRHPHGRSFAEAWARAQDVGVQRLHDIAVERAIEGVPVPIFWQGQQVGERREYDARLFMYVLRHNDPDRYGTGSPAYRLSPATVAKLRGEWEREKALERAKNAKAIEGRMLDELGRIYNRIMAHAERRAPMHREAMRAEHDRKLAERSALGLFGPADPLDPLVPIRPEIPSPHAKPGYEYPRGWGPEGRLPPLLPAGGPKIRTL